MSCCGDSFWIVTEKRRWGGQGGFCRTEGAVGTNTRQDTQWPVGDTGAHSCCSHQRSGAAAGKCVRGHQGLPVQERTRPEDGGLTAVSDTPSPSSLHSGVEELHAPKGASLPTLPHQPQTRLQVTEGRSSLSLWVLPSWDPSAIILGAGLQGPLGRAMHPTGPCPPSTPLHPDPQQLPR